MNVKVAEKVPFGSVNGLGNLIEEYERALQGRGRIMVRYSGTEPLVRILVEGESQTDIRKMAGGIAQHIARCSGV